MNNKSDRLLYILINSVYVLVILTHLELWVAVARHIFKWVKNSILQFIASQINNIPFIFSEILHP